MWGPQKFKNQGNFSSKRDEANLSLFPSSNLAMDQPTFPKTTKTIIFSLNFRSVTHFIFQKFKQLLTYHQTKNQLKFWPKIPQSHPNTQNTRHNTCQQGQRFTQFISHSSTHSIVSCCFSIFNLFNLKDPKKSKKKSCSSAAPFKNLCYID